MGTPAWADFIAVVGLCWLFCLIVRYMRRVSNRWHEWMKQRIEKALKMRKTVRDPFRSTNGYSWDYVFVFKVHPVSEKLTAVQEEKSLKFVLHRLSDAGLQTKMFFSVQSDEIYCKIRCPLKRLLKEADRIDYVLNLDPMMLAGTLQAGKMRGPVEKQWKPVIVPNKTAHDPFLTFEPYDFIFCQYRSSGMPDGIYKTWANDTVLRGVDRLKLIVSLIAARLSQGGAFLDIQRLISDKCLLGYFPLHDAVELRELEGKWLRVLQWPWKQDVESVKNYFGEKIGLYFTWLGHYTTWLIYASLLGFIAWIGVAANNNNPSAPIIPYFCAGIAVWSTMFLEYWKRKEKTIALQWGMVGFEDDEQSRPEYQGDSVRSPVDGSPMLFFHHHEYLYRLGVSSMVVFVLVVAVLGVIAGIFVLRIVLTHTSALTTGGFAWGGVLTSIINAIQIQVLNILYLSVAVRLTDYENHRTDTKYEDALIQKTFLFQFVNSFSALFYIAFVKPYISDIDSCLHSCMQELSTYLGTIFITRLATGSLLQIGMPYVNEYFRKRQETKGETDKLTDVELSFFQEEYHVILGTFADFADMTIQFGYTTMFVAAFPLSTLMSYMNNYLEMRVDAWKLCQLCRRPEPRGAEDIGTWFVILEIISNIAVLVNAGIVSFTASNTVNNPWWVRVWIFISMSSGILLFKTLLSLSIPDVPLEVEVQLRRQKHFLDKILYNIPDENNDNLVNIHKTEVKHEIRINDDDPL